MQPLHKTAIAPQLRVVVSATLLASRHDGETSLRAAATLKA
tara:strand:- start:652 stop:774 length:123 start_codon:yes stop_codon:yes gene_type:complete